MLGGAGAHSQLDCAAREYIAGCSVGPDKGLAWRQAGQHRRREIAKSRKGLLDVPKPAMGVESMEDHRRRQLDDRWRHVNRVLRGNHTREPLVAQLPDDL